jgi:inosine triphosphate pyrophosphatase
MPPKSLNFITGNKNKSSEVQDILGDAIPLITTPLDLVEIQGTLEDVVLDKCKRAAATV